MLIQRFPAILLLVLGVLFAAGRQRGLACGGESAPDRDPQAAAAQREVTQGALRIVGPDGAIAECPLKHTEVKADVSGFIARVDVTQTFHNPQQEAIEAVYVFPLPHEAAVDAMTMVIGQRRIVGVIKQRDEARRIYEQALTQGQTAALLEQERPNIFTQSVGNIAPGQEVRIEISYVDVLKYDRGEYEFYFPMVVGPRFIPGAPISSPQSTPPELKDKVSPPVADTTRVPDASRITPPVLRPDVRNGHDISLALSIDAGVPVQNLSVANHQANIQRDGDRKATVVLAQEDSLPNKDFVVRYAVAGEKPELAVLAHTGSYSGDATKLGNGYFMLMMQPKEDERLQKSPPREIVFLVDVSGSMRGQKTAKTREMMQQMLGLCREIDTVQVMTFANAAQKLFERPLPVDESSIRQALNFTSDLRGSGGTNMLEGVKLAIDEPIDKDRIRIVVMLTDGFIGNEAEIIQHVGQNCGDQIRFWTIGIGQSPNMFLIDGVASQGGGMGKRLGLEDQAEPLAHEVISRIQRAQLAKVHIDWGDMQVLETYPARIPELWAGRPVILLGRYREGGRHEINISGNVEGDPVQWPLTVDLPKEQGAHDVLAKVWARRKIEDLMQMAYYADSPAIEEEVTALALDYRLMSQYTSFVAVDQQDADHLQPPAKPPRRMLVPVPLPEGGQWEGFFGESLERLGDFGSTRDYRSVEVVRGRVVAGKTTLALASGLGDTFAGARIALEGRYLLTEQAARTPQVFFAQPTAAGVMSSGSVRGSVAELSKLGQLSAVVSDSRGLARRELNAAAAALGINAQQLFQAAQKAIALATEFKGKENAAAARDSLVRACFLDQAAANLGGSDGQIARNALTALEEIHRNQVAEWTKDQPKLAARLDLVIRDQPIPETIQQLAAAADLTINFVPGSSDDAAALANNDVRVNYLDLRGATIAQALDWVLQPARLGWRPEQDVIIAGADRRLAGKSAWVYNVSQIALPSSEERKDLKDAKQLAEAIKNAAGGFLSVVRGELRPDDEFSVVWFAPGELLVFGELDFHARTAELLAALAAGEDRGLKGEVAKLHQVTAKRAEQHRELVGQKSAARRLRRVATVHAEFDWRLLAAAAGGRLDDEAVTELKIAWSDPVAEELLKGEGRLLAIRSLWIVTESSHALPDERELRDLASVAVTKSKPFVEEMFQQVVEHPDDAEAHLVLLYLALSMRSESAMRTRALELLTTKGSDPSLGPVSVLAESLLANRDQVEAAALSRLVTAGVWGDDLIALTALACCRAGGDAWQAFRAEARQMLGSQPLPGDVVVLVDRLAQQQLLLTRAAQ